MGAGSHRYLPAGAADRQAMLEAIGVGTLEELFDSLPDAIRLERPPEVEGPLSDQELRDYFRVLDERNRVAGRDLSSFLGAGAYRHEIPATVDHLLQRSEFFTVYTPYQPEVSQGTLQAIFEFQTFIALLTGLEVANASLYDGASAFAEGILMADRLQRGRQKVVVSRAIHPEYRATLAAYAQNLELQIQEVGWDDGGATDPEELVAAIDEDTVCVAVQSPNYFGVVEGWDEAVAAARRHGALTVAVVTEALSLALLKSPGEAGCDIAVGEAQSFGLPLAWGGPYLGFLAARDEAKRSMPGRLAGRTVDMDGQPAFVLTLSTREQHIRREKATSNICTNQNLCALAATIYLALHGKVGLRRLAEINLQRTRALVEQLEASGVVKRRFAAPHFNEVALESRLPVDELLEALEAEGVLGGVRVSRDYPELEDCFLMAVTECNRVEELTRYAELIQEMARRHRAPVREETA